MSYLSFRDDVKPEKVDDLIEDILNRYSESKTMTRRTKQNSTATTAHLTNHHQQNNSSILEVKNTLMTSSISNNMMMDEMDLMMLSHDSELTDIEKLAQSLLMDVSHTNNGDPHPRSKNHNHSFSTSHLNLTVNSSLATLDNSRVSLSSTSTSISASVRQRKPTVPIGFRLQTEKRSQNQKVDSSVMDLGKKELSECTFKPTINPNSSQMIQASGTQFFDRAMEWKRKVQIEREKLEKNKNEQFKKQNTFQPNINPNVTETTATTRGVDVHSKLYNNSMVRQSKKELQRAKLVDEEMKDCTFKPKLMARSVTPVQSRYMSRGSMRRQMDDRIGVRSDEYECTFAPQIKPNNNQYYSSGSEFYLQSNAFDRLSRPRSPSSEKENLNYSISSSNSYSSTSSSRRPKSAGARLDFQSFLERQNNTLKRKQEKVEMLKSTMKAQPKSFVNPKSEGMLRASSQQSIDFHARQDHHILKKHYRQRHLKESQEKECTFQPSINPISKVMPKRSFEQMSQGDFEAFQRKVSSLKESIAKKESEQLTFNPQTNRNENVKGTLRVLDNPDAYMERIKAQQVELERRALMEQKAKEQRELAQCTFKPETHDAPEYVKRIAESMALTRQNTSISQIKQKPDWR